MKVNKEEVLATLDMIEQNLKDWNQGTFATPQISDETGEVCGTTMCFAGWTLMRHGFTVDRYGTFSTPSGTLLRGGMIDDVAGGILGFDLALVTEVFYHFPENAFEGAEDDEIPPKPELFKLFKDHVLNVTGIEEDKGA